MAKGIVVRSTGSFYTVKDEQDKRVECKIRGKLRVKDIKSTNPVVVGDVVDFEFSEKDSVGTIINIHDRKNYIIRKSINLSKQVHILASNIDYLFLVATIDYPVTTTMFIDRLLLTAEAYRIPSVILFNKIDLYNELESEILDGYLDIYNLAGYKCIPISAATGENLDQVKKIMKNSVSVFAGHSGVGKSSIINSLLPDLNLKTEKISGSFNTGKHTTTFTEMHELSFGGYIIDTPGIKAFGIIDIDKNELFHFFPEIFREAKHCQFYNCTHTHEPNCAVRKAAEEERIHPMRYYNYLEIFLDEDVKYRKPH